MKWHFLLLQRECTRFSMALVIPKDARLYVDLDNVSIRSKLLCSATKEECDNFSPETHVCIE